MGVLEAVDGVRVAPLSHEQEQLWVLHRLMPQAPLGNICTAVTVCGELDAGALRESLAAFIQRHEIWRTTFPSVDGRPVQAVQARGRFTWSAADLRELPEARPEALGRAQEEADLPFDLARGPLVRALLARVADDEHLLFVTLHQVVSDRASLARVFLPELRELYEARTRGRAARLNGAGQYADYATWQRGRQQDEQRGAALKFWQEYLAGAPTVLELPGDRRPAEQRTYRGGIQPFALSEGLSRSLRELSAREGVTLRATLTAAFETLLYRYTGQEDFLLGAMVSARPREQAPGTMGCFANTVVLRADLEGRPSARELLRRAQAAQDAVRAHDEVPFDAIVAGLRPERCPGRPPLVQVLLLVEPEPPVLPAPWQRAPAGIAPQASLFDLCLEVAERPGALTGRFGYNSDLFAPETISRMIGHWRALLAGLVAEPSRPVAELELLADWESKQLLEDWSAGGEVPAGPGIEELIGRQARAKPQSIAVVCDGSRLTYEELDRRSSQLARFLRHRGARAETLIGVLLERSVDQIVALVGILKAGAAYVPLDPEAPSERIQHMMRDTRMPVVLTQQALRGRVRGTGAQLVTMDSDWATIGRESGEELSAEPRREDHMAYVIYTSGSTGRPKGVMVERGVLAAHSRAAIERYRLRPQDRILQFSHYTADASLEQIVPALMVGARLIMRGNEIWSPRQLLAELVAHRVTVMNLSPGHWQHAVREWARAPHELAGTRLRLVILGGERVSAQAVQRWRDLGLSGVRLLNAYGPTEATITATLGEAGQEQDPITIGRPLAGREVYVLDLGGRPVPPGVLGELHIGGPLLARGYLNLPELTKERFVPDVLAGRGAGRRLYKTGDLVRYLADGRIEYVGRRDHQVKVRGYRIELGEIDAALEQHPAVGEAVVVTQGEGEDKQLVAHVVARPGEPVHEADLRAFLAEKLPRHMQPGMIVQHERLPRLATGKPDRSRLPEMLRWQRADEAAYLAPRLLMQRQLVQIWEELLEARPIGIRDNFFHLGGHSLLAAQLVDRIEEVSGQRLKLSTVFAGPTIERLAEALGSGAEAVPGRARVLPVQAEGSKTPFFFLHGDWTGGAFYCFALARACGPDQPFYVLEPFTFSAPEGALTLETVAREHIESMRRLQARGPYRLGGFCNGGLLAYEMARQLEAEGEQVEFLGLINPSKPAQFSVVRAVCEGLNRAARVSDRRRADLFLWARHAQRHVYRRLRPGGDRVRDFGQLLAIEPRLAAMFPPREALYNDYIGVLTWAATGYHLGIYHGGITFYWAREERAASRTWRPVTSRKDPADSEEHAVAGTHMSCITDHIQDLARTLSECLNRVEPGNAEP